MKWKPLTQALVILAGVVLACVLLLTGCVPSTQNVIGDLAYIKAYAYGYTDDADSQDDGVTVDIGFYDSKSETITFQDITVTVVIELYGYRDILDTFDHEKMELVYQQQVTIDHSVKMSEMFGNYIRMPFGNIMVDKNKYYEFGSIKVTVIAPKQGDFQDMQDLVRLYPED